jgi:TatD DNase family protein
LSKKQPKKDKKIMVELVDTHCHIHFDDYGLDPDLVIDNAVKSGVTKMICVGCSLEDSQAGIEFVKNRENCWTSVGLHPHEAHHYINDPGSLELFSKLTSQNKVVAIGETGLDYYYNHSPRKSQIAMLEFQLDLAQKANLPIIFHVRDAFDDFWPIIDNFKNIRGVIHSFSSDKNVAQKALGRNLYLGLNGIMTFTKFEEQLAMAKYLPLDRIVLETDAPFLTPNPFRGKICEPKYIESTAKFLSDLRHEPFETFAKETTYNANQLFGI